MSLVSVLLPPVSVLHALYVSEGLQILILCVTSEWQSILHTVYIHQQTGNLQFAGQPKQQLALISLMMICIIHVMHNQIESN